MSLFLIELRTFDAGALQTAFRAWVDPASSAALESEVEIHLQRTDECWSGAFFVPRHKSRGFFYRVGIAARVGTRWSVLIREASRGLVLAEDSDYLSEPKTWVLGSWGLRAPNAPRLAATELPVAVAASYATRRRVRRAR